METLAAFFILIHFFSPTQEQTFPTGASDLTSTSSVTHKNIATSLPITVGQTTQSIQQTKQSITTGNGIMDKTTPSSQSISLAQQTIDSKMSTGVKTNAQTTESKTEAQTLEMTTVGSTEQVTDINIGTQSQTTMESTTITLTSPAVSTASALIQPANKSVSTQGITTSVENIVTTEPHELTSTPNFSSVSVLDSTITMSPNKNVTDIPEQSTSDSNLTLENSFINTSTLPSEMHNASDSTQPVLSSETTSLMFNLSFSDVTANFSNLTTSFSDVTTSFYNITTEPSINVTMESNNVSMANLSTTMAADNASMTEVTVTYMSTLFSGVGNVTENVTLTENITENYTTSENMSTVYTSLGTTEATTFLFVMPDMKESIFLFIFKGNCSHLIENEMLVQEFISIFEQLLENKLNLTNNQFVLSNISCEGNLHINVTVFNTSETILSQINELKVDVNVSVSIVNETLIFLLHAIISYTSLMETTNIISTVTMLPTLPKITDSVFKFHFSGDCSLLVPDWFENNGVSTESSNPFNSSLINSIMDNITSSVATLSTVQPELSTASNLDDTVTDLSENTTSENTSAVPGSETTESVIIESTTESIKYYEQFANLSLLEQFTEIFQIKVIEALSLLNISESDIFTGNITCGSVIINLTVYNTTDKPEVDTILTNLPKNTNFIIYVKDTNGMYHKYALNEVMLISSPRMPESTTVSETITYKPKDIEEGLNEIEIIVIIVFGVIGSALLIFIISFFVYRCCTTRNSKSFTLADTPNNQVTLEDFTLTKMNRPTPIYTDQGVILTPTSTMNNRNTAAKHSTTTPYNNPIYQAGTNGHYDNYRTEATGSDHNASRTSTENLVPTGKVHTNPGIENPSFSSDDVLDSGSNTSTDLPFDGKVDSNIR